MLNSKASLAGLTPTKDAMKELCLLWEPALQANKLILQLDLDRNPSAGSATGSDFVGARLPSEFCGVIFKSFASRASFYKECHEGALSFVGACPAGEYPCYFPLFCGLNPVTASALKSSVAPPVISRASIFNCP